jgi:hypothetical protein
VIENFKLRVFRVVADSLNLGRAAEELQLPQPAITSQIKTLDQTDWKSEKALAGLLNPSCLSKHQSSAIREHP